MDRLSEHPKKGGELILQRGLHHQNGEDGVDEQGQLHDPGVDGADGEVSPGEFSQPLMTPIQLLISEPAADRRSSNWAAAFTSATVALRTSVTGAERTSLVRPMAKARA
ncbi:MAG TPA: hypothetical protein VD995_09775, partial [Azospirillum sp.]|nr:hypothetical protein [Azospirillum sp.]